MIMPALTSRISQTAEMGGTLWCGLTHGSVTWPIHGRYHCRKCGREYRVPWGERVPVPTANRHLTGRSLVSALPVLLLLGAAVLPPRGAAAENPLEAAAAAFARYTTSQETAAPWRVETIEIDAALTKFDKSARLRAVRRRLPFGRPQYRVLEISGDKTVRQQVIERYLSADQRAAEMPASSVAITPANYNFRYKGVVSNGSHLAYDFQITPKHKRAGLIKGELWLDGETGMPVRQSGRLVKSPSIFVKRIDVTREASLSGGVIESRVTRLSVSSRLFGQVELVIEERPYSDAGAAPGSEDR